MIFFGALSGGDLLRKRPPDRYVFNFRPSYAEETAAAVRYLVGTRRDPARARSRCSRRRTSSASPGGAAPRRSSGRAAWIPTRILRVGYRRNTADVADAIAHAEGSARARLDAVVMVATYKAAAAFVRTLRDAGLALLVTNVSAGGHERARGGARRARAAATRRASS